MIINGTLIRETVTSPFLWLWEIEKELFPRNKIISIRLKRK